MAHSGSGKKLRFAPAPPVAGGGKAKPAASSSARPKRRHRRRASVFSSWSESLGQLDSATQGRALTKWFGARFSEKRKVEKLLAEKTPRERVEFLLAYTWGSDWQKKGRGKAYVDQLQNNMSPSTSTSSLASNASSKKTRKRKAKKKRGRKIKAITHLPPNEDAEEDKEDEVEVVVEDAVSEISEAPSVDEAEDATVQAADTSGAQDAKADSDEKESSEEDDDEEEDDDQVTDEDRAMMEIMEELQEKQQKLPTLHSFLEKQSPSGLRPWQKRMVAIHDYNLYYSKKAFKVEDIGSYSSAREPIHCLPLVVVNTIRYSSGKEFIVQARDPRKGDLRDYKFRAANAGAASEWARGISQHRNHLLQMLRFVAMSKSAHVEVDWVPVEDQPTQ